MMAGNHIITDSLLMALRQPERLISHPLPAGIIPAKLSIILPTVMDYRFPNS